MRYKGVEIPDEHLVVRPKTVVEAPKEPSEEHKKAAHKSKKGKVTREELENLVKNDLVIMADKQGIETKGLTKVELIDAILG